MRGGETVRLPEGPDEDERTRLVSADRHAGGGGGTRVAVIYYSATGSVHAMARAVATGAAAAGGDVRLRRVAETAPADAISRNEAWSAHLRATAGVPLATPADVDWA